MSRATNLFVNFAINGLIFYLVGRKVRNHQTGLKVGLVGGLLSVLSTGIMDSRSDATQD